MKWVDANEAPEARGWFLVRTLNQAYNHLPSGWHKAWFTGREWDLVDIGHRHRVTHWMRIEEPGE